MLPLVHGSRDDTGPQRIEGLKPVLFDLSEENVKVRLHRGRAMLRGWLFALAGAEGKNAFPSMGVRCDRVVCGVFQRLAELTTDNPTIQ
jgi:RNA polymerase sigma-70 factor, ECF subfamily